MVEVVDDLDVHGGADRVGRCLVVAGIGGQECAYEIQGGAFHGGAFIVGQVQAVGAHVAQVVGDDSAQGCGPVDESSRVAFDDGVGQAEGAVFEHEGVAGHAVEGLDVGQR